MKETGYIAFRVGTDEHGAKPPSQFPHRFAVLTWINYGGDQIDPWSLFRECIPAVAEIVGAHSVLAEFWKREKRMFRKLLVTKTGEDHWEELIKRSQEELREEADFPDKLRFERNGRIVLLAETEWWCMVGGPHPYHDSTTISFFSAKDLSKEFEAIFRQSAQQNGFKVQSGDPQKPTAL